MRFEHLVSFQFNDRLNEAKERELLEVLRSFRDDIPGIVDLTAGINETHETDQIQNYTLGLRVTFEDKQALLAYGPHPAHQKFVQMLDGIIQNVIVIDYPIG
ncbi:Dabb family protein [Paenibacillus sp. sgz302251]|uniref:Dabb family protein n=1 Tax=Paenibacillus sp. sgz302251 TaxID=3414493 RepID=UPI003C7C80B4